MPVNPPPAINWLAADPARVALRLRARDAMIAADLFLPPDGRLRDDDRATIAGLLTMLVERLERDLRARLAALVEDRPSLAAALAAPDLAIARPLLERAGSLRDPALVAVLAQRAEEARVVVRLRRARDRAAGIAPSASAPTALLATDADPAIAAAARALAAAEGLDPVGGVILTGAAELPAEVQHRLVWRIAAALRDHALADHGLTAADIDPPIAAAAAAALAGYDEGATPVGRAVALARALQLAGRLDATLAIDALAAGEARLAAAVLAVLGAIGFVAAWEMMLDPDPSRLLLLCRALDLPAPLAADIALRLGEDDALLADRLEGYDTLAPQRAAAAIGLWRLDPAYLDSIAELDEGPRV